MQRHSIVVLGGYGVFGSRIARSLARHPEIELTIAGRDHARAATLAATLGPRPARALGIDITDAEQVRRLLAARPTIVIDTVGPFQGRNFMVAEQCVDAGIHYVDIADGRQRVARIGALDAAARERNVLVVSGASTVPAVSTAIVNDLAASSGEVIEIDVGISPGHSAPRGLATARSILSYCGREIPSIGGPGSELGWGGLTRHRYPAPVGGRWLSNVDTPERAIWRARYPALRRACIRAGLEIGFLHLGLSVLSRGVRAGLVRDLGAQAYRFIRIADACNGLGSDAGAMHVRVVVRDATGRVSSPQATLVAERGDGPQIPATPAALVVKKLLAIPGYAPMDERGARPCIDLLSVQEIMAELRGFAIRYVVER
jgi:Saccharopine dehydrogenase NADP binding domain